MKLEILNIPSEELFSIEENIADEEFLNTIQNKLDIIKANAKVEAQKEAAKETEAILREFVNRKEKDDKLLMADTVAKTFDAAADIANTVNKFSPSFSYSDMQSALNMAYLQGKKTANMEQESKKPELIRSVTSNIVNKFAKGLDRHVPQFIMTAYQGHELAKSQDIEANVKAAMDIEINAMSESLVKRIMFEKIPQLRAKITNIIEDIHTSDLSKYFSKKMFNDLYKYKEIIKALEKNMLALNVSTVIQLYSNVEYRLTTILQDVQRAVENAKLYRRQEEN